MTDSSPGGYCNTIVAEIFSTITSPVFSELTVVLAGHAASTRQVDTLFNTLRKMNEVRPFKLAFLLEGPPPFQWEAQQLSDVLSSETAKGLLNTLGSSPSIRFREQVPLWGRLVLTVGMKGSVVLTTISSFWR